MFAYTYRLSPIWSQPPFDRAPWMTPLLSYKDVEGAFPPRRTGNPDTGTLIRTGIVVNFPLSFTYTAPSYMPAGVPVGTLAITLKDAVPPFPALSTLPVPGMFVASQTEFAPAPGASTVIRFRSPHPCGGVPMQPAPSWSYNPFPLLSYQSNV